MVKDVKGGEEKSFDMATVDEILAFRDEKTEIITIPDWNNKAVKVKGLTKAEELSMRKDSVRGGNMDEQRLEGLTLIYGIVEPKFEKHHIKDLQEKQSGPINQILQAILRLSGMTVEAEKEAEDDFQ